MIIKLGFKNLKKNILMNTLTILQMTVIFIIAISMTSTIVSRFQYYSPLKNILNSRSYYYYIYNGFNPQTGSAWTNTKELSELINEEEKIFASYNAWLEYSNNGVNEDINTISYDNEFLKLYQPELESGVWFKEGSEYPKELIPIVVSQNDFNINTGDTVTLVCSETNAQIQGYIIGKIKDGT